MDILTLVTILAGIAGILGFLYRLFIGHKSLFEWWREIRTSGKEKAQGEDKVSTVTTAPEENTIAASEARDTYLFIEIKFDKEGRIIHEESELRAQIAEATFSIENKQPVAVSVSLEALNWAEGLSKSFSNTDLQPDERISKTHLLRYIQNLKRQQEILSEAISILLQHFYAYEDEIIGSLQGLADELFEKHPPTHYGIDVYRTRPPKIKAVIYLSDDEMEQLLKLEGLATPDALIGSGWGVFDLPREVRFKKAVPAIILAVIYEKQEIGDTTELSSILDLSAWAIGLH